jgi:hypothetical protein
MTWRLAPAPLTLWFSDGCRASLIASGSAAKACEPWAFCLCGAESGKRRRFGRDYPCATTEKPDGYFAPESVIRRLGNTPLAPLLGGGPAVLLQVAHPLVAAASSTFDAISGGASSTRYARST